jgi:uncharacterized protein
MPSIPSHKPYRVGRSPTGLGLFATKPIKKGTKIIRYFGPLLDSKKKKDDAIENKYLFELNDRWTIDGSVRKNIARYINHACKPNAESDVKPRKRKVFIRAIKNIEPGEEINYDYGTDYFKAYLKPIGCKCAACEKKRKKQRAEARAEKARLKAKAERKALKKAEKLAREKAKAKAKLKEKAEREAKKALKLNGGSLEGKAPNNNKSPNNKPLNGKSLKGKPLKGKSGAGKSLNGKHLNGNSRVRVVAKKSTEERPTDTTLQTPAPAPVFQAEPAVFPEVSSAGLAH